MNRWVKWLVLLLLVVVLAIAVSGFVLRSMVGGSAKDKLTGTLSAKLGVPVTVAAVDFDLGQWFRLRPAVTLSNVSVGNPPGFSGAKLFEAEKISAQVSLAALLGRTIEVRSLRVVEPRIAVEKNARGLSNVGALLEAMSSSSKTGASSSSKESSGGRSSLAVDEFSVSSGSLTLPGSNSPSIQALDLKLSNLSAGSAFHLEASAKLFGGQSSTLKIDAHAGPLAAGSLPLDGTVTAAVALSEIPADIRRAEFGNLLDSPGTNAKADLDATVRGDVYGTLSGPAKLVLTDVRIGKEATNALPLSGQTSANMTAVNLMASPRFDLKLPDASLQLGKGAWNGSADIESSGGAASGTLRGSIHNVDISQLLGAFTTANGKMNGIVAVPAFSMQFAGKDANEIRNSLHGTAKLAVTQGHIAALDLVATIERALGQGSQETAGAQGTTAFNSFSADLKIASGRMDVSSLLLDGPAIRADGSGVIGFDHSLHFDLTTHVSGGAASLVNTATLHPQSGTADLPVTVSGTVESPRVRPNVKKVASGAVKSIVDSFLKRK